MKRKLLIVALMATVLVFVLAFSSSAAVTGSTSNEYGTVTYVDGINEVSGYDTTSRAVLINADGTYTTYPAYYIYNGSTGTSMRLSFDALNGKTGESYKSASLIRVEVFANARLDNTFSGCSSLIDAYLPEGVWLHYGSFNGCSSLPTITLPESATTIPQYGFTNCSSLKSIKLSSKTNSLGGRAFQYCSSLETIDLPPTITSLPQDCFHGCSALKGIKIPRDCTSMANYVFNGCSNLEYFDMSEATSLKTIGSNNSFGKVTELVFPEGFKSIIGISSGNITKIVFPNSTESFGVIKCSSLKEFVVPESLTTLGDKAFDYCGLQTVTLPKGLQTVDSDTNTAFFHTTPSKIIFTGSPDAEVLETIRTLLPKATIEFANHCDVYYKGVHTESGTDKDNPDTNLCYLVLCTKCGLSNTYVGNDSTHDMSTVYAYANYFANGTITSTCANEGCIYHTTPKVDNETLTPFFSELVYSTKEDGVAFGIYVEYKIDQDAIALYEELSDKSVKYGVMAIMTSNITGNGPLNVDGTTSANYVVAADVTNTKLECTKLIITGNWAGNADIEITMLGFVTDGEELHYMGSQTVEGAATAITGTNAGAFNAVTYNNITEEVA